MHVAFCVCPFEFYYDVICNDKWYTAQNLAYIWNNRKKLIYHLMENDSFYFKPYCVAGNDRNSNVSNHRRRVLESP